MNKNNISLLLISSNNTTPLLIKNLMDNEDSCDLLFKSIDNKYDTVLDTIDNNRIDFVVFDLDSKDDLSLNSIKLLLQHKIPILFLINLSSLDIFINSDFDFILVDYLIKPIHDSVLKHKIDVYIENILQKKATDYLISLYDENVIASKTDTKGLITYTSKAFCNICGYEQIELIGKSHNIIRHPDMKNKTYKGMWKTITSGKKWRGEVKNLKKDGGFYWVDVVVSPEFNYNGEIIGFNSIRQDITSQKYIEQINVVDYLTKLYNKKYYDEVIIKEISSAARYNYNLSLIVLDIDHFKEVNDMNGHLVGDIVLKEFATILQDNSRISDIVSRIGGEEFTIIVSNDLDDAVFAFAEKLKRIVENYSFSIIDNLTVSIGLSTFIKDDTAETLFDRADKSLYSAKNSGRNKVVRL